MFVSNVESLDVADLEDVLVKVEKSFQITFRDGELAHVRTFGAFCEAVIEKTILEKEHSDSCTSQHCFYLFRNFCVEHLNTTRSSVSKEANLNELFPKHNRKKQVKKLEKKLGYKISVLRPKFFVTNMLFSFLLISFILIFFNWIYGVLGCLLTIFGLYVATKTGKEFRFYTVKELVEGVVTENYVSARKEAGSCNTNELQKILVNLVSSQTGIAPSELALGAELPIRSYTA